MSKTHADETNSFRKETNINMNTTTRTFQGAYWHKPMERWIATAKVKGRQTYVGAYNTKKAAIIASDAVTKFAAKAKAKR